VVFPASFFGFPFRFISCVEEGFVGIGSRESRGVRGPNNASSSLQPGVLDAWVTAELSAGRVAGPFASIPWPDAVITPVGLVEKSVPAGEPKKFRATSDFSRSEINEIIHSDKATIRYLDVRAGVDSSFGLLDGRRGHSRGPSVSMAMAGISRIYSERQRPARRALSSDDLQRCWSLSSKRGLLVLEGVHSSCVLAVLFWSFFGVFLYFGAGVVSGS
jgi:hypothetical protein